MIKKAVLGALAAFSLAGCGIAASNNEAYTCEERDASVQVEERQEEKKKEEEQSNDDTKRFFAQCHDGKYDFDTRCIDFSQGYVDNAINSVYRIERIARYKKNGKQEEEKSHCSSILIDNGIVLTAKHCTHFRRLDARGIKYSMEINLMHGGKRYPLETIIRGISDFAVLEMEKPAELPFFPYPLGNTEDMEAGNFTYMIGYVDMNYPMIREGIVTRMEPNDDRWGKGYFLISNGIHFGDSGGATIAFRDGIPEIIGINCYKHNDHDHAGGVLRADMITDEVIARLILAIRADMRF